MKKILTSLLCLILAFPMLCGEEIPDPAASAPSPKRQRPKVGLVLSGGGAKGMSHIGALKVLEELDIPIDYVGSAAFGFFIISIALSTEMIAVLQVAGAAIISDFWITEFSAAASLATMILSTPVCLDHLIAI